MAIISFAKTVDEFLSGNKTETRRDWSEEYCIQWMTWYAQGKIIHTAYDKLPRNGGKPIGLFKLTAMPAMERLMTMTAENLKAEGGMCSTVDEFCKLIGKKPKDYVAVIRFKKI